MLHIYTCLTQQHDDRLVLLAAAVAALGCHATFILLRRAQATTGLRWLLATAVASGSATWATHFIAMLAYQPYQPHVPTGYAPGLTALSLVVAIGLTALAFQVALRVSRALGGALAGLAVAVMHYLGMAAFRVAGEIVWDLSLVTASVVAGTTLGAAAFVIGLGGPGRLRRLAGAGLLTLAICSLHFTGMAAASIVPDPAILVPAASLPPAMLALAVATGCLLILGLAGLGLQLEQYEARGRAAERDRMHELADAAVEGLLVCDGATIVTANRSFMAMVGRDHQALVALGVADLVSLPEIAGPGTADGSDTLEGCLAASSGELIPVEMVTRTVSYAGRPHCVIAFRDLRDRYRAEAKIRFLAQHDAVTGLANRASFMTRLAQSLAPSHPSCRVAVLALDLDRFKAVNDALGHPQGDALLRQVALRLRSLMGPEDLVAGFGGDEFTILQGASLQPACGLALAERISAAFLSPYVVDGCPVTISLSIGVAPGPDDVENADAVEVLRHADLALQRAKSEGGNGTRLFEPVMDQCMQEARAVEFDLRSALAREEFEVWFQPQLALRGGRIAGFEALVRWRHPQRGLVSPAAFIPAAEQSGLIIPIGAWVLRTAMSAAQAWREPLSIAINLSPVQFRAADLYETITSALASSGLDPRRLELEITESVQLQENSAIVEVLHRLRASGVRIALDDFGTGFSSLSYLRSFPFDKIKIDRSFVSELITNHECQAIVRAIVGLGKSLHIATTAEGVETEEQLAYMRREGCDQIQGYLIGRPMSEQAAAEFAVEFIRESA